VHRLRHKADFEALLASRQGWRSAHFAVHHLFAGPSVPGRPVTPPGTANLSTEVDNPAGQLVDKSPGGHWLGLVVPKRHARRAVTRSLLKRQMRAAMQSHAAQLPQGLWLVRLRQPFAVVEFPSAASVALARAVRDELFALLQRAARGGPAGRRP
jgi:ribonuclease P protein component